MQNLTTIGPAFSEITCLIKMDTNRQTNRQTDTQTHIQADGYGRVLFSYCRGHETSRKYKSYARKVKVRKQAEKQKNVYGS